ncbi:hypothetical protein B0H13DRAFT_2343395 [Mycena leptocephala]|nr:hypothetical protein B0H13DRAFT_2343395 [Mycena leptocephala]
MAPYFSPELLGQYTVVVIIWGQPIPIWRKLSHFGIIRRRLDSLDDIRLCRSICKLEFNSTRRQRRLVNERERVRALNAEEGKGWEKTAPDADADALKTRLSSAVYRHIVRSKAISKSRYAYRPSQRNRKRLPGSSTLPRVFITRHPTPPTKSANADSFPRLALPFPSLWALALAWILCLVGADADAGSVCWRTLTNPELSPNSNSTSDPNPNSNSTPGATPPAPAIFCALWTMTILFVGGDDGFCFCAWFWAIFSSHRRHRQGQHLTFFLSFFLL